MNRQELFDTMVINPGISDQIKHKVERLRQNAAQYVAIAKALGLEERIWVVIGVIHEMECTQNFHCYLGNGQPLNKVTTIVPKGRGPFASFQEGAIDALRLAEIHKVTEWTLSNMLYFLQKYNGFGYEKYHNMNSPYVWAGTNHYFKGKYVADGKFDPDAVSHQIGVAVLLKELMQ